VVCQSMYIYKNPGIGSEGKIILELYKYNSTQKLICITQVRYTE